MKQIISKLIGANKALCFISIVMFLMIGLFSSCDPKIADESLYTFTDKMMGQYLKDSTDFSEFAKLLDTTKVNGLLNSYGTYTCFAPDNQAMFNYYHLKGKKALTDFSLDSMKLIAYYHLISGSVLKYSDLGKGQLPELTMGERYLTISVDSVTGALKINNAAEIIKHDILVHNGIIHKINHVLDPTSFGIVEEISKNSLFTVFYRALIETHMSDSLMKDRDKSYNSLLYTSLISVSYEQAIANNNWYFQQLPTARKYGYTVLIESDETYHSYNIFTLEDLKNYAKTVYDEVYPEDAGISDVTDRRNSLNRFISYHLINKRLSVSGLIDKYNMYSNSHMIDKAGLNIYEYIETMCPGTLIEVTRKGGTNETNLINRIPETDKSVTVLLSNSDKDATNGVYHQLTGILTYNKEFHNVISSKRLRFDAASFFPELTNNDMRGKGNTAPNSQFLLPKGYVERISCSDETVVGYLTPYTKYQDYQGDEIFLNATSGKLYNFTITTPPIPAGNYEVRFGYLTNGKRGVAQLYFDDVPCGVPLNMNTYATNISIGYESPGTNAADPNGYENDKMMRNRGFMKGPACFKVVVTGWSSGQNARYSSAALRKIIGIYTFPTATNHKFMVKGLSTGEFMFDYMEFIPTSAIEAEDIY